ncbi:MAG: FAD:protein FMN transferase [Mariniblastus sp.]
MPDDSEPLDPDSADNPSSSRRDFLKGKSALNAIQKQTIANLNLPVGVDSAQSVERQSAYLEQYSKNAMACEFELLFNMHQYPQAGATAMLAFELIDKIEDQMTVYRPHSEVSHLNRVAFDSPLLIENDLFELLQLAKKIHAETNGAFDITSSALTKLWGFDQRNGKLPDKAQIAESLKSVDSSAIKLVPNDKTIKFEILNLQINLGGIGKGHALDRVADLIETKGVNDFVIHGGQSSVLARGHSTVAPQISESDGLDSDIGWPVGVTHPTLPGVRLGEVRLRNQALGTSGSGRQGFFHKGKRYGHIIDPRTGWPASHFLSTTVISNSAAVSDALATAFFVMPLEEIESYCKTHPDVGAIVALPGSKSKSNSPTTGHVEIATFNLSDNQWQQA